MDAQVLAPATLFSRIELRLQVTLSVVQVEADQIFEGQIELVSSSRCVFFEE